MIKAKPISSREETTALGDAVLAPCRLNAQLLGIGSRWLPFLATSTDVKSQPRYQLRGGAGGREQLYELDGVDHVRSRRTWERCW